MITQGLHDSWKETDKSKVAVRRTVPIQKVNSIAQLASDYSFFTLAPFYVYAGIGVSLPDQYEMLNGQVKRFIVDYQRTVFEGLGGWGTYIEAIETVPYPKEWKDEVGNTVKVQGSVWEDFCDFLQTCGFVDEKREIYWQTWARPISVERPESRIVSPSDAQVTVMVVMPDGNKGRLNVKPGLPARFYWEKPKPQIVETANKAFIMKRNRGV